MKTLQEIADFLADYVIECDPEDGCGRCNEARECEASLRKMILPPVKGNVAKTETDTGHLIDMPDLPPAEGAEKSAMGIVNQLFDLAEVPIEKRQAINDTADKYLTDKLQEFAAQPTAEEPQLTAEAGHAICVRCIFKVNYDKFDKARVAYEKLTAQRQQQPIAEGAEEMDVYKSAVEFVKKAFTDLTHDEWQKLIEVVIKHTTLHAQRIADKMVSERLREELEGLWIYISINKSKENARIVVDEYLKTRDSHE